MNNMETIQSRILKEKDNNQTARLRMLLFEKSKDKEYILETINKCLLDQRKISEYLKCLPVELLSRVTNLLQSTVYLNHYRLVELLNLAMDSFENNIGESCFIIVTT